jgi:small conductance mechanosensitive channel
MPFPSVPSIPDLPPVVMKILVAGVIFLVFWLVAVISQRITRRVMEKSEIDRDVKGLLEKIVKISLVLFGLVTALGTGGVNVSALVAGLGLTGFALGFAIKDALANLLAGVLILSYRPFRRHDIIAVTGFEGEVVQIDLRYTTLMSGENKILIPNSTLFTNSITVQGAQA